MKEYIWKYIADMKISGFFITADIIHEGNKFSIDNLESFINTKLMGIRQGNTGRRFIFKNDGWRIYLTFFPTDHVVDERYAMKNRIIKLRK